MAHKESQVKALHDRVTQLERQLAEAQAAILALTSPDEGQAENFRLQGSERQPTLLEENFNVGEESFKQAILVAPYPLMIRRDDGKVIMINAAWSQMTGYGLQDIPTLEEWARKAYGEQGLQRQDFIINEGFSQEHVKRWGEFEVHTRSGEKRMWDFSTAPLGWDEKGRELVMVMAVDMTERKQTEEALRRSEEKFSRAFQLNPAGMSITRIADGRYTDVNPGFCQIVGYTREQIIGRASLDLGLFTKAESEEIMRQFHEQGNVHNHEVSVFTKHRITRHVLFSLDPIEIAGEPSLLATMIDITERKEAEEALAQSERRQREITRSLELDQARLAAVLRHLPVGVWIADQSGRLIGSNEEADRIWAGESPPLNDITDYVKYVAWYPESGKLLEPEEYPVAVALKTGESVNPIELKIRRFDGSEGSILVSAAPIKDRQGQLTGSVGVNVDITDRKRTEEALEASTGRFNDILRSLGDGLFALDQQWKIIYINQQAAQIAGRSVDKLVGKNLWELWPELRGTPLESYYRQAMERGISAQFRTRGSQTGRWYDVSVYPSSEGITIFYVDKTEQTLAEERFNKAFDASPDALVISRRQDGRIETVNDTFLRFFGYSQEEVIGKTSMELGMFADVAKRQEAVRQLQADGFVRNFELDVQLRSGEIRSASLSIEMLNIGDQDLMLTTLQDITERKRTEQALHASEAKMRAVFQSLVEGVVFLNPEGQVEETNDAIQRFYGHTFEELSNPELDPRGKIIRPDGTRFPVEEQPAIVALRTGKVIRDVEMGVPTAEGRISWRLVNAQPVYDDQGTLLGAVASFFDITDRKQFEALIRKRESILAQAGKMAHLGAWDIELNNQDDVNANPLTWSDEVYRIFGYAPGEVQPSNELFFERVHPDDRPLIQERVAQALITGQPYMIEHRACRLDGEERVVQEHAEIFFDNSGKPARMVGAVQDITERRRAEQALRESEERFRSLADSMPQLVWTALPDGTVDYYNQRYQEYREIKQRQETAWDWAPVLHPEDLQSTVNAWQHSIETGEIYQVEHRVRMANGTYRWHLSRGVPMLDRNGRIVRWFGTATDIHDLKLAQEELKNYAERLEHSNRELEQFAFMASHDLQEPLRKIEMFGDLLLERAVSLDKHERNYLERMRSAAGRMRAMIAGLLQLSRVATQGKPFVPVDLSQVLSEVLSDMESQIRHTGGRVDGEPLPTIEGDATQLRQLLENLIGNALKYHRAEIPPIVRVSAKQDSDKVQILVEDNGIGFAQKDAERIFQPFQRLVGRSQYEGSGMGLAICRRIVERHAGQISALSQPGQGTRFIVSLPRRQTASVKSE